jgi:hypothetical protein
MLKRFKTQIITIEEDVWGPILVVTYVKIQKENSVKEKTIVVQYLLII